MSTIIYNRDLRPREANTSLLPQPTWFTEERFGTPGQYVALNYLENPGIALSIYRDPSAEENVIYSHGAILGLGGIDPIPLPDKFQLTARCTRLFCALKENPEPPISHGGKTGHTFGVAIVLDGSEPIGVNLQTADKADGDRGVRIFRAKMPPQESDFLDQSVFHWLYGGTLPTFTLNVVVNKNPALQSRAYFDFLNGQQVNAVRTFQYPQGFFDDGIKEIRFLVSSSKGPDLWVFVHLLEFTIRGLELTEEELQTLREKG